MDMDLMIAVRTLLPKNDFTAEASAVANPPQNRWVKAMAGQAENAEKNILSEFLSLRP
jgi:hypothetical protein